MRTNLHTNDLSTYDAIVDYEPHNALLQRPDVLCYFIIYL
jgi:hypothetical protein